MKIILKGGKLYGEKIIGFSVENLVGYIEVACLIRYEDIEIETDLFEVPYEGYEVLINQNRLNPIEVHSIEVNGADKLLEVIENEDCLPDIGLLDYEDEEFNVKDVTLREVYKIVLNKVLNYN